MLITRKLEISAFKIAKLKWELSFTKKLLADNKKQILRKDNEILASLNLTLSSLINKTISKCNKDKQSSISNGSYGIIFEIYQ